MQRAEQLGTGVPSLRLFVCGGASVPPNLIYSAHRVLGEGQEGELVVRGAALMLGYRDDDQTREAFTVDGYFRTGDIGHVTAQGAVVITDRKKDLIIRGGESQCQGDRGHPARPLRCSHT